ncbi:hypothetical protein [Dactylosporangium sp. NPDC005555]|uniref:hypothetical protein n=1 Tax=Dactylosporangium sp. NPDC005555 TaxID=3154889 RepID=UPI0033A97730
MRAWRGSPPAARRLVAAYGSLPREVIDLACHAAVPVAVDVGLLHLIRVNFLLDPPAAVPFEAEADLLLSPLVRELGDGLYDIDPTLRPLLLTGLSRRFGPARPQQVAALLEQYTVRASAWQDRPELLHAQRLTAVAVIDPPQAARWLARAEASIAAGTALLAREWLVAVRRSVGDHAPADRAADDDVHDALDALRSGAGDARTAAVHRLGELALIPGADVEAIAGALAEHVGEDSPTGGTARAVLDTITGLGAVLGVTDGPSSELGRTARQHLLGTWRAVAEASFRDGTWRWSPGEERSSISDAQQLLCLLLPAEEIPDLALGRPSATSSEAEDALVALGDSVETAKLLMRVLRDYLLAYRSEDDTPLFTGRQGTLDLSEAFAISARLAVAAIGFVRVFYGQLTRPDLKMECEQVERLAADRLSAALVGLLRSFTVHTFTIDSEPGHRMRQRHGPEIVRVLQRGVERFDELTIGSGNTSGDDLRRPDMLYSCGWSWGVVRDAPPIETNGYVGGQRQGRATLWPDLWCTMLAMTTIEALTSERLLDDEQLRMLRSLRLRYELTATYWTTVGTRDGAVDPEHDRLAVIAITKRDGDVGLGIAALREVTEQGDRAVSYTVEGELDEDPPLWVTADSTPRLLLELDRLAGLTTDRHQLDLLAGLRAAVLAELLRGRRAEPDGTAGLWPEWATTFAAVEVFTRRL